MNTIQHLRKTKGIPPRIAFLPSNVASLLQKEKDYNTNNRIYFIKDKYLGEREYVFGI